MVPANDNKSYSKDDIAAQLRNVVFSYKRDTKIPAADTFDGDAMDIPDPDEREGAVLRGVDMEIPAGSFTVVMGASGGGKSTLLRTLNAVIPDFINGQFDGDVEVLGHDATASRVSEMAESVGMVLQDYETQLFGTSIETEVAFGPENLAVPPEEIDTRIHDMLSLVDLANLDREREPGSLSGGQKQRLVLAGVLAMYPEMLILDEPTSDLDPKGSRDILEVISKLIETSSLDDEAADTMVTTNGLGDWSGSDTIVMVTHKIEEALLADRAVLLRGGQVYRSGPVRDVFTDAEALSDARVAVPPLVDAFEQIGWPDDDLPLLPKEATECVRSSDLTWNPPSLCDESLPGVPMGTGQNSGDPLFVLEDVVHEYETDQGSVRAVDRVNLTIHDGEVVAIVGHNGSGKTTLAKHLNGLLAPDEGTVKWQDRSITQLAMSEIGREIGYVFQNPDHQIFAQTVRKEVEFGPKNFGLSGDELHERVTQAIEQVELDGLEEADPFNFSKGQRQRVALAGILATQPDVIIFDEPTTGLDATQQRQFMDLVARLNRDEGVTIVMVTHDMDTVARYAPRSIVLQDGRKVKDVPTRELFADEDALAKWDLTPPHTAEFSNQLAMDAGIDDALPALSVEEIVECLGGPDSYREA